MWKLIMKHDYYYIRVTMNSRSIGFEKMIYTVVVAAAKWILFM